MANPDWGTKRICQSCGTKFYDLLRDPIVCPKCQTEFDPEAFLKTRRSRPAAVADKELAPAILGGAAAPFDDEVVLDDDDPAVADKAGEDEEDEGLPEDASELGEDEDDMAEVIENVGEDEEP